MGNTGCFNRVLKIKVGSPPHTWGIRQRWGLFVGDDRITPTYMGNTQGIHRYGHADQDHPPHTWGIPPQLNDFAIFLRITPTYMGNTCKTRHANRYAEDHPHIHGEYYGSIATVKAGIGSPPHTWGIPIMIKTPGTLYRITPTYMGNTLQSATV